LAENPDVTDAPSQPPTSATIKQKRPNAIPLVPCRDQADLIVQADLANPRLISLSPRSDA
jgi:hypothetical protein